MKTSNYILISFFTFIVGSIFVLFIAAIGRENDPYDYPNSEKKEYSLGDFSVIVVESAINIEFKSSENNSLSFPFPKDKEMNEKPFRMNNDTLVIYPVPGFELHHSLRVSGSKLSTIIAKNSSHIRVDRINSEMFSVDVQQTTFTLDNSEIRELNIQGDRSRIRIYSNKVDSLSARLKNESFLDIYKNINKINIEKDETSRYSLYR